MYVGLLRALGDRGLTSAQRFDDPIAQAFLPSRWASALEWIAPALAKLPARVRALLVDRVDLLVVRALAIDAELTAALAGGATQVVILGAGFDDRPHRMAALRAAHVFEVDHPATQAVKRLRAAPLSRTCRALTYVACDFEREGLAERLHAAGHRSDEPTIWICEGVTLYLEAAAIRASLAAIAARSAASSTLILEYHDAEAPTHDRGYSFVRAILLALWSEPHIGARSQDVMHAELAQAGLCIARDFAICEWGTAFARTTPRVNRRRARLAIATRDP